MKIPLAWLQLSRQKIRLMVAIAGIGFADILMFMQLGFRDALFDSSVILHKNLEGDIFLISPQSTALISMKSFPHRRLYQALGFDGVKSISPVYLELALWKNPETRGTRSIMALGFNPTDSILSVPGVKENLDRIKLADIVLFDDASRPEFGPIAQWFKEGKEVYTEVKSRRIKVGGLFTLGASFGADGNMITSDTNFLSLFSQRDKGLIDIGIVKLEAGANLANVLANMRKDLPQDVRILSKEEFVQVEKHYWQTSTSIGFVFTLGTIMGFIVGIVIVYQILYTDVDDHLPEYATLKAMGYKNSYLLMVVFQEALMLAVVGYVPGFVVASGLYTLTRNATSLPMGMDFAKTTTVLTLTIVMCSVSGAIAVRKLQAADPADIF
ncbi:ABC transporter permease DevC [Limnofasciculus baicalensis]|uniref:ABC transporter permease DevC n=1 Tax=Limnofasciculus baicalensis BBK-W-15 TaxID=2699891 RepID=A0AAE3GW55_9CYAN|nr:ABC transporter permease DevC [Limnofasciculus baicalensis]MCP2731529.1 ABC transporter permease DevC [Limnofasciculus baicalensis BBK-W-15]